MYSDSILILEGSKELAADVVDRDKEADKLQWFIERQFNMMLEDSSYQGNFRPLLLKV